MAPQFHPDVSAAAHLRTRELRAGPLIPHTCVQLWPTLYLCCSQSFQLLLGNGYHQIQQTGKPEEPAGAPLCAERSILFAECISVRIWERYLP